MNNVIDWLVKLPAGVVLGAAILLPLLESSALVGQAFPGETAVLIAGAVAGQGALPLWLVILVAAAGGQGMNSWPVIALAALSDVSPVLTYLGSTVVAFAVPAAAVALVVWRKRFWAAVFVVPTLIV